MPGQLLTISLPKFCSSYKDLLRVHLPSKTFPYLPGEILSPSPVPTALLAFHCSTNQSLVKTLVRMCVFSSGMYSVVKNLPANAGDTRYIGLIPGSRRSPGVGNGTLLQSSCVENSIVRGTWQSKGPQRVRRDWATAHATFFFLRHTAVAYLKDYSII